VLLQTSRAEKVRGALDMYFLEFANLAIFYNVAAGSDSTKGLQLCRALPADGDADELFTHDGRRLLIKLLKRSGSVKDCCSDECDSEVRFVSLLWVRMR